MSKVIHFEIYIDEPERAIRFYSNVFGWKINSWGDTEYWLAETGAEGEEGIHGALQRRGDSNISTLNTIAADSLDDTLAAVTANGGKIFQHRMAVPGVGYWAMCTDSEGNPFGVMQQDEKAA